MLRTALSRVVARTCIATPPVAPGPSLTASFLVRARSHSHAHTHTHAHASAQPVLKDRKAIEAHIRSLRDASSNCGEVILSRVGMRLHTARSHPIRLIKTLIADHFASPRGLDPLKGGANAASCPPFVLHEDLLPVVTVDDNFDALLIPKDHVSRSKNDTYYLSDTHVLRTHTSAHQNHFIKRGEMAFLAVGDCFRRDEVDRSHYPVFHQMEGVRIFTKEEVAASGMEPTDYAFAHLKATLEGLARHLFGDVPMRFVDAYFPFTNPSAELEIFYNNDWLEVLGSGVIHPQIMTNCGRGDQVGWAFGLGLERLAMVLYEIPDIRLFWTDDERFISQFECGLKDPRTPRFKPYSSYPPVKKDISFWTTPKFSENDMCELVRETAGDLVETVTKIDEFSLKERVSFCYRITFRSMDRNLTNAEINTLVDRIREALTQRFGVTLR